MIELIQARIDAIHCELDSLGVPAEIVAELIELEIELENYSNK